MEENGIGRKNKKNRTRQGSKKIQDNIQHKAKDKIKDLVVMLGDKRDEMEITGRRADRKM